MRTYQFKTIQVNEIPNNNRPIGSTSVQSSSMNSLDSRIISPHIYPKKELETSSKRLITEPTYANNLTSRLTSDSVLRGRTEIYQQNKLNGESLNVNNSNGRGNLIYTQPNNRSSTYRMSSEENEQPTYSNQSRREYQVNESIKTFEQKTNTNNSLNQSAGAHNNMEKLHETNSEAVFLLESKIKALEEEKNQLSKSVSNAKHHSEELETQWKSLKAAQEEQSNRLAKSIQHEEELCQNHKVEMQRLREEFENKVKEIEEQRLNEEAILRSEAKEMEQKIANLSVQSSQESNLESFEVRRLINDLAMKEVEIQELEGQLGSKNENMIALIKNLEEAKGEVKELKELKEQMQKEKYEQFDEILMTQMQSIKELKEKIEGLNENCNELKEKIIESERKNESLTNEIAIMELRHKSEVKNLELQSEIESNTKHNAIDSLQKKMITMEEKYKMAVSEIKTKDEFFRQHLLGRTDQSDIKAYIVSILEKYQSTFRKDENS